MRKSFYRAKNQVCQFNRWANKGYSVFNSLKLAVKICVIPVTYSLVVSPTIAVAQTDTSSISKYLDLNEVVIESNVKAEAYSELTRVVSVVKQEQIQQLSASSIQDVLEKLINVDIRQRGVQGVQADMNFRGGSFDQVLVLLNGVNITDPQTGHHNLNIPIDLNSIQRIEILQGPGARVYGPGAFSGAINIITKPETENSIKISSKEGENGLYGGNIQVSFKTKYTNTFLSYSRNQCDGYIDNTDYKISNLFLHTTLTSKIGDFSLFSGYQRKGFGANSFYTPKYPNQFEQTKTLISSLEYEKKWNKNKILFNSYLRENWDKFELFRSNPATWYTGHNYHLTTVGGGKISFQHLSQLGRTQVGIELRNEGIISNRLGDTLSKPIKIDGTDSLYYTMGDNRLIYNVFADQTFYFNRFSISGGFNYSYCNKYNGNWSYGVDASYQIVNNIKVYTSVNRSFRNPTFNDLYYRGSTNYGNPELKPESAITYEGGFKFDYALFSGNIGYFHRDGKNIIDWIKLPSETKWHTQNYTSLSTDGFEMSLSSDLKDKVILINSVFITYSRYWCSKQSGNFDSYYALDYIKNNLKFGINHQVVSKLSASWNFTWQQRAGDYIDASNVIKTYNPFWLIDFKLNWIASKYSIFAEATNIFNSKYVDIGNIKQPGRWIFAGFSYKFSW